MYFKPKKLNKKIDVKSYMQECEMEKIIRDISWRYSLNTVRLMKGVK